MANHDALDDDDRTDAMPKVSPAYADPETRDLGERLASLYHARDVEPGANVGDEIARVRAKLRRGPRLHAGEFLQDGRYRLVSRQHGHPAQDQYWAAWDRKSQEIVFVRVFHGEWVDDEKAVEAFRQRGQQLRQLSHGGIGRALDADRSEDGFVFLVTRMVGTSSLSETKLDPTDAVQLAIELAQALAHAHEHGVVHGAVRPDNVRLDPDGHAWLVGFSVEGDHAADQSSLYRAPETAERGYSPRPAADVYSLGMTLLATLNQGELPFWVLRDPTRLIRTLPVSEAVRQVIQRATDWDLASRYGDLASLIGDVVADPVLVESLASKARNKSRYATAAEHYETLLRLQPHRAVEIRTLLGHVYTELGAYDRAFQHLLAALERTAEVEVLFEPLRTVASRTGDWSRLAQALWTQARARDPGRRVVLRTELARINQQELGNAVAAAETWSQVLADHRLPHQAATALRALQELARTRSDWQGFVDYGQELLAYVDGEERSRIDYAIGRAYLEHLKDEDKGLSFIDRAEAAGYSEIDLGARLQVLRAQRGQWQRVIQLMVQQASNQDIGEASPTLLRAGIIASSVHLEDEALQVYHALLERAPKHVVALRHLARLHHRAHEHDKALRFYERLWETYRGKESEEPEASERAADCTAYAQILLERAQVDEAVLRLDEALRLNGNHVPSLEIAGPLFTARGEVGRAGQAFERLLSLFKSVELSPQKISACLGMGELAWVQGRLTAAMGWYNRALELDPFSVVGWWGLAKVALAARAGHPGTDRAPWVMAMPRRATGFEALARLLGGVLAPSAMRAWLARSALGRAFLEAGADGAGDPQSHVRVAAAVVDVLARHDLIGPELFRRLGDACPEWSEPIDEVNRLVLGDGAATFPIVRTYRWLRTAMAGTAFNDFSELEPRTLLPTDLSTPGLGVDPLDDAESWHALLSGERPAAPIPFTMIEPAADAESTRFPGPIGALVRDGETWLALRRDRADVRVGSAPGADLQLAEDRTIRADHARLYRQGSRIYVEAGRDARLQIDGEDRRLWRLIGGERVTVGETRLQYQAFDDESKVPPPARGRLPEPPPAPEPPPEPVTQRLPPAPEPAPPPTVVIAPEPAPEPTERLPPAPVAAPEPAIAVVAAAAVAPVAALGGVGAFGESTGPLDSPLPMPAVSHEPQASSEPVQMPRDVLDPVSVPIGHVDDDEPPSDEERLQVLQGHASPASTASVSDVPEGAEEPLAEDGAALPAADALPPEPETARVNPADVRAAEAIAAADDEDEDEERTASRAMIHPGPVGPVALKPPPSRPPVAEPAPPPIATPAPSGPRLATPAPSVPRAFQSAAPVDTTPVPAPVATPPAPRPPTPTAAPVSSTPAPAPTAKPPPSAPPVATAAPVAAAPPAVAAPPAAAAPTDPAAVAADGPVAPLTKGSTMVPEIDEEDEDELDDSIDQAPSWLREALAEEARRASGRSVPPATERVTVEIPNPPAAPPPEPVRPTPKGLVPTTPPKGQVAADGPALANLPPVRAVPSASPLSAPPIPGAPGAVTPVRHPTPVPIARATPAPAPTAAAPATPRATPAPAPETKGFGFPTELQSDDVDALQSSARKLPSGISGPPPVVPVDRSKTPSGVKSVPLASMEFVSGPERGRRVMVHDVLTIGSGPRCGISIPGDSRLSPIHCRVEKTTRGYWLRDEQSANGTVVNGQRITDAELKGGEVVMVGRTVLRFRVETP